MKTPLFRISVLLYTLLWLFAVSVYTKPVTMRQSQSVVAGWLKISGQPLGATLGHGIGKITAYQDDTGANVYYVVSLHPDGYVLVAADDEVDPILGFSDNGSYQPTSENPLFTLVSRDAAERIVHVRAHPGESHPVGPFVSPAKKWQWLSQFENENAGGSSEAISGISSLSDERVAPLVSSKWDQMKSPGGNYCYNYYTPNHYPCGCVATAMAQLMRFYQRPTAGVGTTSFNIEVDNKVEARNLRGGDGAGGAYSWSDMVLVPTSSITDTQRKAIGSLTHDAGVSVWMSYTADGSSADTLDAATAFVNTFSYANAIQGYNAGSNIGNGLNGMVNPNLDAGYPVLFGITDGTNGHAIVCDGYGYSSSTLYHHLNLGWSGSDNAWYNLPTITTTYYKFITLYKCVYNVYTSGTGEIISGRVLTASGSPLSGVTVTAKQANNTTYVAQTNSKGIYALTKLPSNTNLTISASKSGYSIFSQSMSTGQSINNHSTSGNLWNNNFSATSYTTVNIDGMGVTSDISSSTDTDIFEFNNDSQRTVVIDITTEGSRTLADSVITLRGGNGTDGSIIQTDDDSGDGNMSRIIRTLAAGKYRVEVTGFNGCTGSYLITLSTLNTLTLGKETNGDINNSYNKDWYTFTVGSSGTYLILTSAGLLNDGYLYLYDHNHDSSLEEDDDDGPNLMPMIERSLSANETYYIKVTGYSNADTGSYSIVAARLTTVTENGGAGSGNISTSTDEDWFKVAATAGTRVIETTNRWGTLEDSILMLYDASFSAIEQNDDGGDDLQSRVLRSLSAANYYIRVRGFNSSTGTFDTTVGSITTLTVDAASVTGTISGGGSEDWYKFTISTSGATYVINTTAGTLSDSYLYLYDSTHDDPIAVDDDSGDGAMSRITQALSPGTYYVKVVAWGRDITGSYGITVGMVPYAPNGFYHSANTPSSITWCWQDNSGNESGFHGHDASHTTKWTTSANVSSYTESGLGTNTQYTRHVHAYNSAGDSLPSNELARYTSIQQPTGVTFGSVTTSSIQASASGTLSNLASGSSGLQFYNTSTANVSAWQQTNTPWSNTGLAANSQYTYCAQARNGDGDGTGWSASTSKYTLPVTPSVTCDKSINTAYAPGTTFTFTNARGWVGGGVNHYHYLFNQQANTSPTSADTGWSAGTLQQSPAAGSWYLHVLSHNPEHASNGVTHYGPFLVGTIPATPGNFSHGAVTPYSITWTWQDLSDNEIGFHGHDNASTLVWTSIAGSTSYVENGLSPNTQYTRHLHAYSAVGDSAGTAADTVSTQAAPPPPPWSGNLTQTSVRIAPMLGDNPDQTELMLQEESSTGSGFIQSDGSLGTMPEWKPASAWGTLTLHSLLPATSYRITATARNMALISSPPGPSAIVTTLPSGIPPTADFMAHPTGGPAPFAVQFTDLSNGEIMTYLWDFGDGGVSQERDPQHVYATSGSFTLQLTVTGPLGMGVESKTNYIQIGGGISPVADFSAVPRTGVFPLTVNFTDASLGDIESRQWDFGDGSIGTKLNPTHIYQLPGCYTVRLTVFGPYGTDEEEKIEYITVDEYTGHPPEAAFSAEPTVGAASLSVQFHDESSGQVDVHCWDFGDSSSSTAAAPQHVYSTPGVYTVSLTVGNAFGNDVALRTDYITVEIGETPPEAPTITPIDAQSMGMNTVKSVNFSVQEKDTPADSLVVTVDSSNTTLLKNTKIISTQTGTNRILTITPETGKIGSATITVTVTDEGSRTASTSFVLSVNRYKPDLYLRPSTVPTYTGVNIISLDGASQTIEQMAAIGVKVTYYVQVQNLGTASDSLTIHGPAAPTGWTVVYKNTVNGTLITDQITGSGWTTPVLAVNGTAKVQVDVTPGVTLLGGACATQIMVVTSGGDSSKMDVGIINTRIPVLNRPDLYLHALRR